MRMHHISRPENCNVHIIHILPGRLNYDAHVQIQNNFTRTNKKSLLPKTSI